jgi:hypothetical protein
MVRGKRTVIPKHPPKYMKFLLTIPLPPNGIKVLGGDPVLDAERKGRRGLTDGLYPLDKAVDAIYIRKRR